MTAYTAETDRRMTFQPISDSRYARPASLPAGYPVTATQDASGKWELVADVDGDGDYRTLTSSENFILMGQRAAH